jgi:hypothetical protein
VAGSGHVYAIDPSAGRISEFTSAGTFVRAFGWNVDPINPFTGLETCTTSCQAGVLGAGAGQLNEPFGAAIDRAGNIYTAEFNNGRVSEFTPAGGFIRAFGWDVNPTDPSLGFEVCHLSCKIGVSGTGTGQFGAAFGVATDCYGAVYVADTGNSRISRFGEAGTPAGPCMKLGKTHLHRRKGTATLAITVPAAGTLSAQAPLIKRLKKVPGAAKTLTLQIKPTAAGRKHLRRTRHLKVRLKLKYTAEGGTATATRTLTLHLPRHH